MGIRTVLLLLIICPTIALAQYDKTIAIAQAMSNSFNLYGDKLTGNLGTELFGMKFPLIKKAIVSGFVEHDGVELLLLDGHNNLGFSGGPAVAYDETSKQMRMVGVISGYLPEPIDVKHKNENLSVMENSGIIVCYGTRYVADIFRKNNLH